MRRILFLVLLAAVSLRAQAQSAEATYNTPITQPSKAKIKVMEVDLTRAPATARIYVTQEDSSNGAISQFVVQFTATENSGCPNTPSQAPTPAGLSTAVINAAANETGTDSRRFLFRVTTYLTTTTGCIQGVTLVP